MLTQKLHTYEQYHRRKDSRDKPPGCFDDLYKSSSTVQQQYEIQPGNIRLTSARIYPNGEFGIGFIPREKKAVADKRYDRGEYEQYERTTSLENHYEFVGETDTVLYTKREVEIMKPKLGIGSESSQTTKKYGTKGITAYGRKILRNAGHLMDVATKGKYGAIPQMGTLTIPSLEPDDMRVIALSWADIVRKFFQKCRRRYEKLGLRFDYASCTEIQPGRWIERGEVGLHIHFLFIAYRLGRNEWSLPDNWVRDEWKSVLESCLGEKHIAGCVNYRREAVRDSSAAYIAKYASKGTEFVREIAERHGAEVLPSQWWSISSALRHCIKAGIRTSRGMISDVLLDWCKSEDRRFIKYVRCATIDTSYTDVGSGRFVSRELVLGFGGMLTKAGISLILEESVAECVKRYLPIAVDRTILAS